MLRSRREYLGRDAAEDSFDSSRCLQRQQVGKGSEVSLVGRARCGTAVDAEVQGHRLEVTIVHKCRHDRVEVAGSFGLTVLLEEAQHLSSRCIGLCSLRGDSEASP